MEEREFSFLSDVLAEDKELRKHFVEKNMEKFNSVLKRRKKAANTLSDLTSIKRSAVDADQSPRAKAMQD